MTEFLPHRYTKDGIAIGRDRTVMERAASRIAAMQDQNLEPILSLGHLAHLTGASYNYLRQTVERSRDPYVDITRPKRGGGTRSISSPEPMMMDVQRWVLRNILDGVSLHPASYAYKKHRSTLDCAKQHLGCRWMVKLDLHDFFGTITEQRVYRQFRGLGYPSLISLELARVCTRLPVASSNFKGGDERYTAIRTYSTTKPGVLPQGGPTSGALANAVTQGLDHKLASFASSRGYVYTRYSDDLTFSSTRTFDRRKAARDIAHIRQFVEDQRFIVHDKKTRVVPPGARHVVLGLLLGPSRVQLLPEFKRRIELHIRGVERFGLAEHARYRGFRSLIGFVNHVDGCLAYAAGIDGEFATRGTSAWNSALQQAEYFGPIGSVTPGSAPGR